MEQFWNKEFQSFCYEWSTLKPIRKSGPDGEDTENCETVIELGHILYVFK